MLNSKRGKEVLAQLECRERLSTAWNITKEALDSLSNCFQSVDGYENIDIALCFRGTSRCDVYSVPTGDSLKAIGLGFKRKADGIIKSQKSRNFRRLNFDLLYGMSTKQFRAFFTSVRISLGLKNFNWPEVARRRFQKACDDPVPSGPGRANSGRDKLILMLRLCCDSEESWNISVRRELSSLYDDYRDSDSGAVGEDAVNDCSHLEYNAADEEESRVKGENWIHDNTDEEPVSDRTSNDEEELSHMLKLVKNLPSDSMVVRVAKKDWVSVPKLMELICYPNTSVNFEWYVQRTPADGNCLFSAVMMAANVRGLLPVFLRSTSSIRGLLKKYLLQLSNAGLGNSTFRREWLLSCIHDIDDRDLRSFNSNALEKAMCSGTEADIEYLLQPLRLFVSNWASMVGASHWGGLLRIELSIFASATGCVIEVLQQIEQNVTTELRPGQSEKEILCDTRCNGSLVRCRRVDLVYPVRSKLPCPQNGFVGPTGEGTIRGGWIGPYPLLRVVLNRRHYNACTSKHGYPISPAMESPPNRPWSSWFNYSDTLVEPYSVLTDEEDVYYRRALSMIDDWRVACQISPDNAAHADPLIMHSKNTELSVSMLSHLDIPTSVAGMDERYMLSDEIVTCYMHLLEKRSNDLAQSSSRVRSGIPLKCRYMDSWFYTALSRGLAGPSSRRRKTDFSTFSMIILPALVNGHWLLVVCYTEDFVIGVYDPLHERREDVFRTVKVWAQVQIPPTSDMEWSFEELRESRGCSQQGVVDCGVYICKAAESLGLSIPIRISQWDVPYVRKRMMVELLRQEAISIRWPRTKL